MGDRRHPTQNARNCPTCGAAPIFFGKQSEAADEITALREALQKIARGKYDGLEVTHYTAGECRDIARAILAQQGGEGD